MHADQDINMFIPLAHSQFQDGHTSYLCTYHGNGSFQHDQRLLVPWSLQTSWCLVECERPRSLFFETQGHEHCHCTRRQVLSSDSWNSSSLIARSLVRDFGSYLRVASSILPAQPSDQQKDQSRSEHPHGTGRNVCFGHAS